MNTQKIVKFNLIMSGILFSAAVLMFISVTIAWFSDTKKVDATFTSGNVRIALTEAAVKPDASGNLVEDKDKPRIFGAADEDVLHNYGRVYPGMSIYKDPTVENIGDVPEWIAVKVTITDGTGDIARAIGDSRVVVKREPRQGKGKSCRQGDGKGSYPPLRRAYAPTGICILG